MIRHEELYQTYRTKLHRPAEVCPIESSLLLPPLDSIVPYLYAERHWIHQLPEQISQLASAVAMQSSHEKLSLLESMIDQLLHTCFSNDAYLHLAAHVVAAGDQLDTLLFKQINSHTKQFAQLQDALRKQRNRDRLVSMRTSCNTLHDAWLSLEQLYSQRGLPEKAIARSHHLLQQYGKERQQTDVLRTQIDTLILDYQSIGELFSVEHLARLRKASSTGYFGGSLAKSCNAAHYPEGIVQLKALHEEVNYILRNRDTSIAESQLIRSETQKIKALHDRLIPDEHQLATNDLSIVFSSLFPADRFDGTRTPLLLSQQIVDYQTSADAFMHLRTDLLTQEQQRVKLDLDRYGAAVRSLPASMSGIGDYLERLTTVQHALHDCNLRVNAVGDTTTGKIVLKLLDDVKDMIPALQEAHLAYATMVHYAEQCKEQQHDLISNSLSPQRLDAIAVLKKNVDGISLNHPAYKAEGMLLKNSVQDGLALLVSTCLTQADQLYRAAEEQKYDPVYVLSLYKKLHAIKDISERIAKTEQLIRTMEHGSYVQAPIAESVAPRVVVRNIHSPSPVIDLSGFDITEYFEGVVPENQKLKKCLDILNGEYDDTWPERFTRLSDYLSKADLSQDASYCHRLSSGIEQLLGTRYAAALQDHPELTGNVLGMLRIH
ncbi:hypothetical protein HZB02_02350 [Candidatus Woesearchaeota archaeon]|nr:hypothetical protein [Candidatus Woesearchaeota archaeon]